VGGYIVYGIRRIASFEKLLLSLSLSLILQYPSPEDWNIGEGGTLVFFQAGKACLFPLRNRLLLTFVCLLSACEVMELTTITMVPHETEVHSAKLALSVYTAGTCRGEEDSVIVVGKA